MSNDEEKKERFSAEVTREIEAPTVPTLPTVNPAIEEQKSGAYDLPAAVYVVIWISLSSSIIIFNKWILDTAKFRTQTPTSPVARLLRMLTAGQTIQSSSPRGI